MVNPSIFNQNRFAATQHVAGIGSLAEGQDHTLIDSIKAPAAGWTAIGVVNGLGGTYTCHKGQETSAADREKGKTKVVFFPTGLTPDRLDFIRPNRPSGRIFHALHEISGRALDQPRNVWRGIEYA
jgi:hypothetical protein